MTSDEIAKQCETLFQNGGPAVYTYNPDRRTLRPSYYSAARTVRLADSDHHVWARRKVSRETRYTWKQVGVAL